ncbi:hypothetical protein F5Y14DRAFT_41482 [Nemania sp. NC0429]|nr:hypothetical protein F5Y14DRAFT_41482 [Nemania sp. NC0429]
MEQSLPLKATTSHFTFALHNPDRVIAITFGEATPEQLVSCRKLAGAEFGTPLAEEDYIEQEQYLGQKPLVKDGGWRVWCLSPTNDRSEVLATCKTIPRELLVSRVSGTGSHKAYCIASVVTNPRYRGHGLASRLLELVAEWLDGPGDAVASILYSSIGDFYHRRGWRKIPASLASLSWPDDFSSSQDRGQLPETRTLSGMEVPKLCDRDVGDVECQLTELVPGPDESHLCVLPSTNIITWLHSRSDFIGTKLRGTPPNGYGSICDEADTWLYWYHDFRKQQLDIQRVRLPTVATKLQSAALAAMLLDAVQEARVWNFTKIILWDSSPELLGAMSLLQQEFRIKSEIEANRQKSVPSLRWRHADETSRTVFHFNEFYTWS